MATTDVKAIPYDTQQLMAIYNLNNEEGTRQGLIAVLEEMRGYINPENEEDKVVQEHIDAALQLLGEITDFEFGELDLAVDFPS